jgi:predicted alpha/beta-hydrolase family hydrolase
MDFTISSHTIQVDEHQSVSAESYSTKSPRAVFVFAHGAGAGMNHSFMKALSSELAQQGIAALRFNFLYMEQKKKRPDFPAVAHKAISAAIYKALELFPSLPVFAGGKSFGGRMTSQFLSSNVIPKVKGVVFVGFPLHPAGKPSVERATHLNIVNLPMLFLQGTRDALAEWKLIEGLCGELPLSTLIKFEGADHSFKAGKQNLIPVISAEINNWMKSL